MKANVRLLVLVGLCSGGCCSYNYRVAQPATEAPIVSRQPILIPCQPLTYRVSRHDSHLALRISNPTDDRVMLLARDLYLLRHL